MTWSSPHEHGWLRPTLTCEMLGITLQNQTGVIVPVTLMRRALKQIGARMSSPNSTQSDRTRNKRLRRFSQLLENLPDNEAAVFCRPICDGHEADGALT